MTTRKATESILLFTQEVAYNRTTTRERKRERIEEDRLREREREREETASLVLPNDVEILQNSLLTIFTKNPGSRQICVRKFSANDVCFLNCGGSNSKRTFFGFLYKII